MQTPCRCGGPAAEIFLTWADARPWDSFTRVGRVTEDSRHGCEQEGNEVGRRVDAAIPPDGALDDLQGGGLGLEVVQVGVVPVFLVASVAEVEAEHHLLAIVLLVVGLRILVRFSRPLPLRQDTPGEVPDDRLEDAVGELERVVKGALHSDA